jgi:hypothetical protein
MNQAQRLVLFPSTMNLKQLIPLFAAAVFFVAAAYPKPILIRVSREPHPQQRFARLCLFVLGLLALWWYAMRTLH